MKKKLIKGTILLFFNSDPKLAIRLSKYNYIYRKTIISEIRALAMALTLVGGPGKLSVRPCDGDRDIEQGSKPATDTCPL